MNCFAQEPPDASVVLERIKTKVNKAFETMDARMNVASRDLSAVGLDTENARIVLQNLYKANKYAVDTATISLAGKMILVEPEEYRKFEGVDISAQEHVVILKEIRKPVFSKVFRSVEGLNSVDFQYPVFSSENELLGSVSMLLKPQEFIELIALPVIQGTAVEFWVMQIDGLTIYGQDQEEAGRNIFTDEFYKPFPEFVAFCERIAREENGFGEYDFLIKGLNRTARKKAVWDTVSFKGINWKIVCYTEIQ